MPHMRHNEATSTKSGTVAGATSTPKSAPFNLKVFGSASALNASVLAPSPEPSGLWPSGGVPDSPSIQVMLPVAVRGGTSVPAHTHHGCDALLQLHLHVGLLLDNHGPMNIVPLNVLSAVGIALHHDDETMVAFKLIILLESLCT